MHPGSFDDSYQLDDRYEKNDGQVFLTGTQALVRLPLMQAALDRANGLNTAGFISGYRGSPLGGYDMALWKANKYLEQANIKFQPGINEELAATAVLGTQQVERNPKADYDGVFGIWYGKGPGVDRAGDALKHGNAFGASPRGGVLVVAGDDHNAVSSSMNHQSEQVMESWMMPVLAPAGLQDYFDFGLYGFALSRFSGCWSGFIATSEIVESAGTVNLDLVNRQFTIPAHEGYDPTRLHYRWPDPFRDIEYRLMDHKLKAVDNFARHNSLDRMVWDCESPRLGIVTCGKASLDLAEALRMAGIDARVAEEKGIALLKIGMTWPLQQERIKDFTRRCDKILVIEEKRSFVERQIRDILYNMPADQRPPVIGKQDENGAPLLRATGELCPEEVLAALLPSLKPLGLEDHIEQQLDRWQKKQKLIGVFDQKDLRTPYFCSGCPHNRSTKVPDGSRALAGIGCHFMATKMDRDTECLTQMGGEGVNWLGQAPFTHEGHIFQNLGDGTYYHSGLLAIRQAIAAGVNITYKILYNDAIAMTGGQPLEGTLLVDQISRQLHDEGVRVIRVLSDEPDKYLGWANFAPDVQVLHRDELDTVQRELREIEGVTAIIYDQTCAAEKRRRRKKKEFPDPPKRAFINELVCESCGDCSVQSNCVSIVPVETELGRKRSIDQSSCNKDYSCIEGFCPSFVTVEGGQVRKGNRQDPLALESELSSPALPKIGDSYDILITGIGGTGVVTIGQIITMAAHLEGKAASVLDFTGFAQKGGSVYSYVRVADKADNMDAVRIASGHTDLLLGCDMVVAGSPESLRTLEKGRSHVILNAHKTQTAQFTLNRDADIHDGLIHRNLETMVGRAGLDMIEATELATLLMGDSIATNMFLMGYAWQKGKLPLSLGALYRAIELNGVAVASNKQSFVWGRLAAELPERVRDSLPGSAAGRHLPQTLDERIDYRAGELTAYQNQALADRYRAMVERVRTAEQAARPGSEALTEAVAKNYYKLLAIKDEYEVARLYTDGRFRRKLAQQFEGDYSLKFHMAPPLLADKDSQGHLKKMTFGSWMMPALKLVAKLKFLRGTAFDIFGKTEERRSERALLAGYESLLEELLETLDGASLEQVVSLASLPAEIRGFGHVKEKSIEEAKKFQEKLLDDYRKSVVTNIAAE
ncbi:indolepyruvate ferredoxin oxidoreductase family protein [Emcibacter nanhaiensis]|uniref:Indolepyruvate ferredoxin oxidoreductase family protein n=2 Tax=Emcibacter nanhaiensis TaxID=1505037 RepID=A0A501PDC8_9PROT|nr:indolepyruvate ferredoxin oxidoreductase family protein [Emcibacter nanhaiensis]